MTILTNQRALVYCTYHNYSMLKFACDIKLLFYNNILSNLVELSFEILKQNLDKINFSLQWTASRTYVTLSRFKTFLHFYYSMLHYVATKASLPIQPKPSSLASD